MPWNTNLTQWLSGSARDNELRDTRRKWDETQDLWRASLFGRTEERSDIVLAVIRKAMDDADRLPARPVLVELCSTLDELLAAENIGDKSTKAG